MSQTEVQLIKDAVIVNADVSNSAAIDVSKISGAMPLAGGTFTNDVTFEGTTSGRNIVFDRSENALNFADSATARFGAGDDLQIYHSGSHSHIQDAGTGNLRIQTNNLRVENAAGTENQLLATENDGVELYYDNSKILETETWGVMVTGTVEADQYNLQDSDGTTQQIRIGASGDLRLYHTGSDSVINQVSQHDLEILHDAETMAKFVPDGAVELYHDNSKKFETASFGATLTGNLDVTSGDVKLQTDNKSIQFGASADLTIKHSGSTGVIDNVTGDLHIKTTGSGDDIVLISNDDIELQPQAGEAGIKVIGDGAVELYHDNSKKFETASYGVSTDGVLNINGTGDKILLADDGKIAFGGGTDLKIYHNGNHSFIEDSGTGNLFVKTSKFAVENAAGNESLLSATQDGSVELYYDGTKKAETNADGFRVSGALQSSSGNGNYYLRTQHTTIQEGGNSVTITLSGLTFSWGVFRIGGYASAGQASVSLHILFGGYMTHTNNYHVTILANHAQNSSISLTKNNSNYVITITNNAANYDLFCNMMIESANSGFTMTLS